MIGPSADASNTSAEFLISSEVGAQGRRSAWMDWLSGHAPSMFAARRAFCTRGEESSSNPLGIREQRRGTLERKRKSASVMHELLVLSVDVRCGKAKLALQRGRIAPDGGGAHSNRNGACVHDHVNRVYGQLLFCGGAASPMKRYQT